MKIFVKAKTGSSKDLITKIDESHLICETKELPINGRANLAIIKLLADYYRIPQNNISICLGYKNKNKIFNLDLG